MEENSAIISFVFLSFGNGGTDARKKGWSPFLEWFNARLNCKNGDEKHCIVKKQTVVELKKSAAQIFFRIGKKWKMPKHLLLSFLLYCTRTRVPREGGREGMMMRKDMKKRRFMGCSKVSSVIVVYNVWVIPPPSK